MRQSSTCDALDEATVDLRNQDKGPEEVSEVWARVKTFSFSVADADRVVDAALLLCAHPSADAYARGEALLLAAKARRLQTRFSESLALLKRSRHEFSPGNQAGLAGCDLLSGAVYAERGDLPRALSFYERAEAAFRSASDLNGIATCTFNRGLIHFQQVRLVEATESYRAAKETFASLGRTLEATICEMNAGNVHNAAGRFQQALETFAAARDSFMALGDTDRAARCRSNAGNAFAGMNQPKQAISMFLRARADFQELGQRRMIAACSVNIASARLTLEDPEGARSDLESALSIFEEIGDVIGMGECFLLLSSVHDPLLNAARALECFTKIGDLLQVAGSNAALARASSEHRRNGHWRRALKAVKAAARAKGGEELGPVIAERFHDMGPALITHQLSRVDVQGAVRVAEECDGLIASKADRTPETLVRYFCDDQITQTLFTCQGANASLSYQISRAEISSLASALFERLSQPGNDAEAERLKMHNILIRPLRSRLGGTPMNLWPGHILGQAPFASLTSESGTCLIEEMPLVVGLNRIIPFELTKNWLVVNMSKFSQGLPDLPLCSEEASYIRSIYPEAILMRDAEAEVSEVAKWLERADVIHLGTHSAETFNRPDVSALVLHPDAERPSGLLYARDIARLKLNASLVVISACTGASGSRSLAKAFLSAGAKAVLASSWRALDEAAFIWMRVFYSELIKEADPARAHQAACRHMLNTRFSSPHYWALWNLYS